jgi:hypothetical protein
MAEVAVVLVTHSASPLWPSEQDGRAASELLIPGNDNVDLTGVA